MVTINGIPRSRANREANVKLKKIYSDLGINYCEECGYHGEFGMSFHHSHKRIWFYDKDPEWLGSHKHTIMLCAKCHLDAEVSRERTRELFLKHRNYDIV